ncbi:MAG TPA: OmpA family protein [Labilithrix sp.]|jgi:peptidoglycan-associated lipoprotein
MHHRYAWIVAGTLALSLVGCAHKPAAKEPEQDSWTTGAKMKGNINVSRDLVAQCSIQVNDVGRAPKFDFDEAALLPEDRDVLEQVARCVTQGPMKGRKLLLVGRADPRGETEYNMVLGQNRADTVRDYLLHLGVAYEKLGGTTRGELDAEGKDEDGWKRDRRVDILLD